MISVDFWARADVVEILRGLSLSKTLGHGILKLIEERGIADVPAAL
jgi:hypothetical protein